MKNVLVIAALLISSVAWSQDQDAMRKIESARIALITERLELTPEQAEKFWPLYREYTSRREELRKEFMDARKSLDRTQMTEQESKQLLEKGHQLKERQLLLDKNYSDKFTNVITTRQLLQLRKAEEDFRQMLLNRLEHRREQRERMHRREDLRNNN